MRTLILLELYMYACIYKYIYIYAYIGFLFLTYRHWFSAFYTWIYWGLYKDRRGISLKLVQVPTPALLS